MLNTDADIFLETIDINFRLFGKPSPDREVKAAWWRLLKGFDIADIKAAFGKHAIECKFAPKPADIVDALKAINSLKAKAERENAELIATEQQAALPAPAHNVDTMQMLNEAKELAGDATQEDRRTTQQRHDELIAQDKRLGRIRTFSATQHSDWRCPVNHCHKPGSITQSQKGSEKWYCSEHARMN